MRLVFLAQRARVFGAFCLLHCTAPEAGLSARASKMVHPAIEEAASERDATPHDATSTLPGERLVVDVGAEEEINLKLGSLRTAEPGDDDWDLRFSGWQVLTNGGPVGPGDGGAYGPTDELEAVFNGVPDVPFRPDYSGGAFEDWYSLTRAGVESHLFTYVVRDGDNYWKLQILDYYGGEAGVTGGYVTFRYAQVRQGSSQPIKLVTALDAGADNLTLNRGSEAGCINLSSGERWQRTQRVARALSDWHLCFSRTYVVQNSGVSGPGQVEVAHLNPPPSGSLADSSALFDDVEWSQLAELTYRRDDRIIGIIGDAWVRDPGLSWQQRPAAWLVRGSSGQDYFALLFTDIVGATQASPGQVHMRVKRLSR